MKKFNQILPRLVLFIAFVLTSQSLWAETIHPTKKQFSQFKKSWNTFSEDLMTSMKKNDLMILNRTLHKDAPLKLFLQQLKNDNLFYMANESIPELVTYSPAFILKYAIDEIFSESTPKDIILKIKKGFILEKKEFNLYNIEFKNTDLKISFIWSKRKQRYLIFHLIMPSALEDFEQQFM